MPNSTAALNVRLPNSDSGSIGVATRRSVTTNANAAAGARPRPPATSGCASPSGRHSMTAPVNAVNATTANSWPSGSMPRAVGCGEAGVVAVALVAFVAFVAFVSFDAFDVFDAEAAFGSHAKVAARPAAHSGRFTRKMLRQPNVSISTPPITGPAAIEIEPVAVHRPTARARSFGSCAHD